MYILNHVSEIIPLEMWGLLLFTWLTFNIFMRKKLFWNCTSQNKFNTWGNLQLSNERTHSYMFIWPFRYWIFLFYLWVFWNVYLISIFKILFEYYYLHVCRKSIENWIGFFCVATFVLFISDTVIKLCIVMSEDLFIKQWEYRIQLCLYA